MTAKTDNDTIEIWYIPKAWESHGILLIGYRSAPKEWIVCPGAECFIAPPFDSAAGIRFAQTVFGAVWMHSRQAHETRCRLIRSWVRQEFAVQKAGREKGAFVCLRYDGACRAIPGVG
jgi:hypothetical protein